MNHFISLSVLLINVCFFNAKAHSQCVNNLLSNGSLNGSTGENTRANQWQGFPGSPDLNDASGVLNTSIGYSWTGVPVSSSDGGTWQNIIANEFIEQTIYVQVGVKYYLNFEYAAQGIYSSQYNLSGPVGVNIFINNTLVHQTADDITQYTWENACFSFVADTNVVTVKFLANNQNYLGIDGICVSETFCISESDEIIVPTVFTPNNDNVNDFFGPQNILEETDFKMNIYNRWGVLLAVLNKENNSWDGTYNGEKCNEGTYYYDLILPSKTLNGFFNLFSN